MSSSSSPANTMPSDTPQIILSSFGIGAEEAEENELDVIHSMHDVNPCIDPMSFSGKLDRLADLLEVMHVKSRDNNAILFQMLGSSTKKIELRINAVRAELIAKIEAAAANNTIELAKPITAKRSSSIYGSEVITPLPGFVIKSRKLLGEKEKAFINVFYHADVEFEPGSIPKDKATDKPYFIAKEEASTTTDKDGTASLLYNIVVSAEYFNNADNHLDYKITAPNSIHKILHKVNIRYGGFLDEGHYSLPRVAQGYKGETGIPEFIIPKLLPEPPPSYGSPTKINGSSPSISISAAERRASGASSLDSNESAPRTLPEDKSGSKAAVGIAVSFARAPTPTDNSLKTLSIEEEGDSFPSSTDNLSSKNTSNDANPDLAIFTGMGGIHAQRSDSFNSQSSEMTGVSGFSQAPRRSSQDGRSVSGSIDGGSSRRTSVGGASHKTIQRKSVFDNSKLGYLGGTTMGRNLLSGDMCEFVKDESLDSKGAQTLMANSADNPEALLGWQIQMNDTKYNGIFVVTDIRKNYLQKTEYRVSKFHAEDVWVRLKRENPVTKKAHSGYTFRPLRMVLYGLADDEEGGF